MNTSIQAFKPTRWLNHLLIVACVAAAGSLRAADVGDAVDTAKGAGAAALETLTATSFIKDAAQGNAAEIASAEAAQSRAESSDVKQFAKQIREDHQAANEKL